MGGLCEISDENVLAQEPFAGHWSTVSPPLFIGFSARRRASQPSKSQSGESQIGDGRPVEIETVIITADQRRHEDLIGSIAQNDKSRITGMHRQKSRKASYVHRR